MNKIQIYFFVLYFYIFCILILISIKDISLEKSYTCNYVNSYNIYNNFYLYFSNEIKKGKIILIGVSDPLLNHKLSCSLYYSDYATTCNISISKLYITNKRFNLTYISLYVEYNYINSIPVSININKKIIPLLLNKPNVKYKIILAIVNFYGIKNYKQVIDVIEISKIYGVEHVVLYVTYCTVFIKSILFYYLKNNFVELIPFCFNDEIKYVHGKGQIEKMNDMLYRYMHYTKYIIYHDIDEVIVLTKFNNYILFLNSLDNQSSDIYRFKSKLFPYSSLEFNSITKHKKCCVIKRGYEKYIVGNLYKFITLSVHIYLKSLFPIQIQNINESSGYVRHTRFNGRMCKSNLIDKSLDYLNNYLTSIYKKFESIYENNSEIYYFGK